MVTAATTTTADVAVSDGRIAAIEAGIPAHAADRSIDARGLLVLPGVVDAHTHVRLPSDTMPDRFFQDSVGAAFGGTTTFLAFDNPGTGISAAAQRTLRAGIREWLAATAGESAVDIGLSAVITAQQDRPEADLAFAIDEGVATFKCFLVYDFGVSEERLRSLLSATQAAGGLLQVHGEDRAMLDAGVARELSAGRTQPRWHAASRPPHVEATGTRRAIDIAAEVDAPVFFVHVSSAAAAAEISRARCHGQPVLAETCPQYLSLDESCYDRPDEEAIRYVISPPLRAPADVEALWGSLRDGRLDLVATDHVPDRMAEEKRWRGQPFDRISNGSPGIETLLPVVYGRGVAEGRLTIERAVDLLATTPARLFGLPRKGALEVGRDADIVLLDPAGRTLVRAVDQHHSSDFTLFEGQDLPGAIRRVILRGRDVVRDGVFVGRRGEGRYQARGPASLGSLGTGRGSTFEPDGRSSSRR